MKAKVSSRGGDSRLSVKKGEAEKDPNKPKRPPSAFFVFMEGFRKEYKEKHPNNKQVSVVGKAGGEKWKSLTDAEKAPYVAKADKLKAPTRSSSQRSSRATKRSPGAQNNFYLGSLFFHFV